MAFSVWASWYLPRIMLPWCIFIGVAHDSLLTNGIRTLNIGGNLGMVEEDKLCYGYES